MRLWDSIFPDDREIVIWGAGENGREWFDFLTRLGKKVCCFIDKNAESIKKINGVKVVSYLDYCASESDILLITPFKGAEDILLQANKLGYGKILLASVLRFIPRYENLELENVFPPFGHYYSLYPDFYMVDKEYEEVLLCSESRNICDSINVNEEKQCVFLGKMNSMYKSIPNWPDICDKASSKYRFRRNNQNFGMTDSLVLHFMIRLLNPHHYIEVGSGYTSALALDTNEYYMEQSVDMRFIEPYPDLFYSLLKDSDNREHLMLPKSLQEVPLSYFDILEDGDVLFIDSTHVAKFGSDVNYLFFHVFPRLKKGVYVHLHDICYPWQYPKEWILRGTGWNEMYLLRAFLQHNDSWEIIFYTNYMTYTHAELFDEEWRKNGFLEGGSFWMRKTK